MDQISLKTYAKVNITLDVTGVREDGYHEVRMIMQALNLYDEIVLRTMPSDEWKITIKSNKYYVPADERNTAYKAAAAVIKSCLGGMDPFELRIDLKKVIPVAAGLAGGSSNAAGVIVGMNRMLGLGLSLGEMCGIGTGIGADVPFCIMSMVSADHSSGGRIDNSLFSAEHRADDPENDAVSTAVLAEGIGEKLTPVPPLRMWAVLVKPHFSVSTAAVYKALDSVEIAEHPDTEKILSAMRGGNITRLRGGMVNVLENVTLVQHPETAQIRRIMQKYNNDLTVMSGSGPTVFSLFTSRREALRVFNILKNELDTDSNTVLIAKTL